MARQLLVACANAGAGTARTNSLIQEELCIKQIVHRPNSD